MSGLRRGKLVRDRIPAIIRATGAEPTTYQADPPEYKIRLMDKLVEEVAEVAAALPGELIDELADVVEVVYAIAEAHGIDHADLELNRRMKAVARGGFGERIVWLGNDVPKES